MLNVVHLIGNLGKDPELRYTPSGQAVCSFSVASTRKYTTGNGEQVKETIWFRVQTWGKLAEVCNQYLKKGGLVYVEGRLIPDKQTGSPRVWNKQDGTAGASFEVNAQTVRFLSRMESGDHEQVEHHAEPVSEEDIPF